MKVPWVFCNPATAPKPAADGEDRTTVSSLHIPMTDTAGKNGEWVLYEITTGYGGIQANVFVCLTQNGCPASLRGVYVAFGPTPTAFGGEFGLGFGFGMGKAPRAVVYDSANGKLKGMEGLTDGSAEKEARVMKGWKIYCKSTCAREERGARA